MVTNFPKNEYIDNRDCILSNPEDWYNWLSLQEQKWKAAYREMPERFISDFLNEQALTRDYEGREILELLQNASDAAAEAKIAGKVCIELSADGLIVANTGAPFTRDGVVSLQLTNVSPKRHRRDQYVGNKGLGFRAVLNWSKFPIILSGGLRIAYNQEDLEKRVLSLLEGNMELADCIQKEKKDTSSLIAPVLVFPGYTQNGDLQTVIQNNNGKKVYNRCLEFISEGYTTTIGMPFDQPDAYENAKNQINALAPELLLFIPFIDEIVLRQETLPELHWKRESDETHLRVFIDGKLSEEWRVYRTKGTIPAEIQKSSQIQWQVFEAAIAIPNMIIEKRYPLYSYFPLDINLPFPCICHATLDLAQNRNHLHNNEVNKFVVKKLAELLVTIAEIQVKTVIDNPWAGCDLLICRGELGPELNRLGFYPAVIEAVKKYSIIPTLTGEHKLPSQVLLLKGASQDWLPVSVFNDIVPEREQADSLAIQDKQFFKSLSIQSLDDAEFSRRLTLLGPLTIDQRGSLIAGMVENFVSRKVHTSALLLDTFGENVPENTRVFLPPTEGVIGKIPEWAKLRFLNEGLKQDVQKRLRTSDMRELQKKLENFRVIEYSLENIIRSLLSATKTKMQENPEMQDHISAELIKSLFTLFNPNDEKRTKFPSDITIQLPNLAGNYVDVKNLYISQSYMPYGRITQDLYGSWAPEKLIGPPEVLGLKGEPEIIRKFLEWIGVFLFPRFEKINLQDPDKDDYRKYVIKSLKYPVQFEGITRNSSEEVMREARIENILSVDGLNAILKNANPYAILAWLAVDPRAAQWNSPLKDYGQISIKPYGLKLKNPRYFSGPIQSYIHWKIAHTEWLPTEHGIVVEPANCIMADRAIESLFSTPQLPSDEEFQKYNWKSENLHDAWLRAGVVMGLGILEREDLYRLLLQLPEKSPDGKSAQALYLWAINREATIRGELGPNFKEFKKQGMMWGRFGESPGYFPVTDLLHIDTEDVPSVVLNRLKLVSLPKRAGSEKVERLFGVKSLDRKKIQKKVSYFRPVEGHEQFAQDFKEVIPYLRILRTSITAQQSQLNRLQSLNLILCYEITAEYEYEGTKFIPDMKPYDWIIIDESIIYIKIDPTDEISISSDLIADAIGAAIAPIFELGDGGDFSRIISCKNNQRASLIQKMLGKPVDIEALKRDMAKIAQAKPGSKGFPYKKPEEPEPKPELPQHIPGEEPGSNPPTNKTSQGELPGELVIIKKDHEPSPPGKLIAISIKKKPRPGPGPISRGHQIVDGHFCEEKTLEFEEKDTPPRYPLLVSHITGYKAPGCDVVSFISLEDRKKFLQDPISNGALINRFIEVKSRSDKRARIDLKGNELDAAIKNKEKYFLYRFFEEGPGHLIVSILQDPYEQKEAINPIYEVNLEQADNTQVFELVGGLLNKQQDTKSPPSSDEGIHPTP